MHNGAFDTLESVVGEADVEPLAAFLRALNEDYE